MEKMKKQNEKKNDVKEKRKSFYDLIDKKTGVLSNPEGTFYSIPMKGFPAKLFDDEWEKDVKETYGGIRWAKAWSDHLKAKAYDALVNTATQVALSEINNPAYHVWQGEKLKQEEKEKEEEIPMFGDGGM